MSRIDDQNVEAETGKFLDKHFYPHFQKPFERCYDKARQFSGCDISLSATSVISIDEKVKHKNCLNTILQYPSFELSFINRAGNEQVGWFLNKNCTTDIYNFVAVFLKSGTCITEQTIDHLNVLLVRKADIEDVVSKHDSDKDLWDGVQQLRDNEEDRYRFDHRLYWLKISRQFSEQPVNLVTTRQLLKDLKHTSEFNVYTDHIERA